MMRIKFAVLVVILQVILSACGDATPAPGKLSIYIAQASQDVAQLQTQAAARATATSQAITFRATQTALARADVLAVTRSAADTLATRAAMTATMQSIKQTQLYLDRASGSATQTAVCWPTAAWATSEALYAAAEQRRIDNRNLDALSAVLIGLGAALAVGVGVWVFFSVKVFVSTIVEKHRHECAMNRAVEEHEDAINAKLWGETHTAEPDDTQAEITIQRKRSMLANFERAGDARGFSIRKMTPAVCGARDWARLTDWLIAEKVLVKDTDAKVGTRWADGYDLARGLADIESGATSLPEFIIVVQNPTVNTQH